MPGGAEHGQALANPILWLSFSSRSWGRGRSKPAAHPAWDQEGCLFVGF